MQKCMWCGTSRYQHRHALALVYNADVCSSLCIWCMRAEAEPLAMGKEGATWEDFWGVEVLLGAGLAASPNVVLSLFGPCLLETACYMQSILSVQTYKQSC